MKRLESLRRARGWSKAELARRAELSESDVGKIESGRLRPYPGQLRKLARALHVSGSNIAEGAERIRKIREAVLRAKRRMTIEGRTT